MRCALLIGVLLGGALWANPIGLKLIVREGLDSPVHLTVAPGEKDNL